jgi:hypothetical protein
MRDRLPTLSVAACLGLALAIWAPPAVAQSCFGTAGAYPADHSLWAELRPTDTGRLPFSRDSTDYNGTNQPDWHFPLFSSLDPEGGFLYVSYSAGFQVWDVSTAAFRRDPQLIGERDGWRGEFLAWPPGTNETREWLFDVDAPDGVGDLAVVSGLAPVGIGVWSTAVKTAPSQLYQDTGLSAYQVYAAAWGGHELAFAAVEQSTGNGLHVYDLAAARGFPAGCAENTTSQVLCPGVHLGRLGPLQPVSYVDGSPAPGGRHLVAYSSGVPVPGVAVWNVTNPLAPVNLRTGGGRFLDTAAVYGVAVWEHAGHAWLGVIQAAGAGQTGRIFDLTPCLASGCASLAGREVWSRSFSVSATRYFLTDSKGEGGMPYLYFGNENMCSGGLQREWLYEVSNPAAPVEIGVGPVVGFPNPGGAPNPYPTDYWSWYYAKSPTGFRWVMPRTGKFAGRYFYRAAWTILDPHELVSSPAAVLFADGFESGDLGAWSDARP